MHVRYWFILLLLGCFSCIPPEGEMPRDPRTFDPSSTDLMELSSALPYFKDFIRASGQVKIASLLNDKGPYTIFMPNQLAFSRFRSEKDIDNVAEIPDEELKEILLYHIIHGRWLLLGIPVGYYPTLALESTTGNPIDLYIDTGDLLRLNGVFALDEPDLESTNGVIHSINAVLDLPTVMTHLSVNLDFSMIYEILNRNDIRPAFPELLEQKKDPCTLLAPDNAAIIKFLEEHPEWNTTADIPAEQWIEILKFHLIRGENFLVKDIEETAGLIASNGSLLLIQPTYPGWMISVDNQQKASIVQRDIQATNGVIHRIDRVMIPAARFQE